VNVRVGAFADLLPQGSPHRRSSVAGSKHRRRAKQNPLPSRPLGAVGRAATAIVPHGLPRTMTAFHPPAVIPSVLLDKFAFIEPIYWSHKGFN
jgi:hypothetical protein